MIRNNRKLYESIMRDVAKTVKKRLNENINNYDLNWFINNTKTKFRGNKDTKVKQEFFNNYSEYILKIIQLKDLLNSIYDNRPLNIQLQYKKYELHINFNNFSFEIYEKSRTDYLSNILILLRDEHELHKIEDIIDNSCNDNFDYDAYDYDAYDSFDYDNSDGNEQEISLSLDNDISDLITILQYIKTLPFVYNTYNNRITSKSEFIRISNKVYQNWLDEDCDDVLYDLENKGIIPTEEDIDDFDDEFDDIWNEVEPKFLSKLDDAVGGDWYQVGNSVGLSNEQLENIYVDKYQAKTDPVIDYYN